MSDSDKQSQSVTEELRKKYTAEELRDKRNTIRRELGWPLVDINGREQGERNAEAE